MTSTRAILLLLAGAMLLAGGGTPDAAEDPAITRRGVQPVVPCTCRFRGNDYRLGEVACIADKLRRCERVLNNTSWSVVQESCVTAMAPSRSLPDPVRHAAFN